MYVESAIYFTHQYCHCNVCLLQIMDNMLIQVVGHKRVVLFSPQEANNLYLDGTLHQITVYVYMYAGTCILSLLLTFFSSLCTMAKIRDYGMADGLVCWNFDLFFSYSRLLFTFSDILR